MSIKYNVIGVSQYPFNESYSTSKIKNRRWISMNEQIWPELQATDRGWKTWTGRGSRPVWFVATVQNWIWRVKKTGHKSGSNPSHSEAVYTHVIARHYMMLFVIQRVCERRNSVWFSEFSMRCCCRWCYRRPKCISQSQCGFIVQMYSRLSRQCRGIHQHPYAASIARPLSSWKAMLLASVQMKNNSLKCQNWPWLGDHFIDKEEDGTLRGQIDPLANDPHELGGGDIGGHLGIINNYWFQKSNNQSTTTDR